MMMANIDAGFHPQCSDFVRKGVITSDTKKHRDNLFHTVYAQDKVRLRC